MTDRTSREYEAQLGREARERQERLAAELHLCCAEWKEGPHHEGCKNYVPDETPVEIEGQGSLL